MHVSFFEDKHNRDLVRDVLIEFDSLRINAMITALPSAMLALMKDLPRLPESDNTDFEADEQHRKELNKVIQLAELLEEVLNLVMTRKTISDFAMTEPSYWEAASAFRELQKRKEARIAITHRDLGENFGSATGFQTYSYNDVAQRVTDWLYERHTEREKAEARAIEEAQADAKVPLTP
jgi:hypothetical protein